MLRGRERRRGDAGLLHVYDLPSGATALHVAVVESDPLLLLVVVAGGPGKRAALLLQAEPGAPPGSSSPRLRLLDQAPLLADGLPHVDAVAPCFSNLLPTRTRTVLCAAVVESAIHLVSLHKAGSRPDAATHLSVSCDPLCKLLGQEEASSVVVHSLALGPSGSLVSSGGLLALVAAIHPLGGGPALRCAASLALGSNGYFSVGPWFQRNVHPTTSLVLSLADGTDEHQTSAAMLLLSSQGARLLQSDGPLRTEVAAELGAAPTAAIALAPGGQVLVADAAGQLHLLDVHRHMLQRVHTALPLPLASCLALLPRWFDSGATALFVGSSSGSSAVLEVPADPQSALWQVAPEPVLPSLAPVREAVLVPDPSGCGDARLLCCCGMAPHGRLAAAWLAAALEPLAEGQQIPGQVRLIPLRAMPASPHHTHLLLSMEDDDGGSTLALAAQGSSFAEVSLPALLRDSATLLAAAILPAGLVLQVCPSQARVARLADGKEVAMWQRGPITLAALHGQFLALASGSEVHCLWVSSVTGRLQEERSLTLEQQASALALFDLPVEGGEREQWIAVGLWVRNEVLLQQLAAEEPAVRLQLGPHQPRSLLVAQLGSAQRLFVGTATGELLWWDLQALRSQQPLGPTQLTLVPRCWVRVGLASVDLQLLPPLPPRSATDAAAARPGSRSAAAHAEPSVLARSDQALVVEADPASPDALRPVRLHGGRELAAACPFQAEALPLNSLAWVQPSGQLTFGVLDAALALRWEEVELGAAPASLAYHAPSGCVAVACMEDHKGGGSTLQLLDLAAPPGAAQLISLPMSPGHVISAVAVVDLPCSGAKATHLSSSKLGERPRTKQFLLVASCLEGAEPLQQAGGLHELPAVPMHSAPGEAWWRQAEEVNNPHQQQQSGATQEEPGDATPGPEAAGAGDEAAAARPQGLLSVFEVRQQASREASSSSPSAADRPHQLVLHGTVPLPAACYSLAGVVPAAEPLNEPEPDLEQQQSTTLEHQFSALSTFSTTLSSAFSAVSAASVASTDAAMVAPAAAQPQPLLLAGCYDGLRLYRVYVDDANAEAAWAVEQRLVAISVVDPLQLPEEGAGQQRQGSTTAAGEAAAGPTAGSSQGSVGQQPGGQATTKQLWHQRVALQLLSEAPTCDNGVVVQLTVRGPLVFTGDLASGVTAFCVQPPAPGLAPVLVPLSADLSGSAEPPVLALGDEAVLAAVHGQGLGLLWRDPGVERQQWARARERAARQVEQGGHVQPFKSSRLFVPGIEDVAEMELAAACSLTQGTIAALAAGRLGVRVRPLPQFLAAGGAISSEGGGDTAGAAGQEPEAAVYVTTSGAVGAVCPLTREQGEVLIATAAKMQAVMPATAPRSGYPRPQSCLHGDALLSGLLRDELQQGASEELADARQTLLQLLPSPPTWSPPSSPVVG